MLAVHCEFVSLEADCATQANLLPINLQAHIAVSKPYQVTGTMLRDGFSHQRCPVHIECNTGSGCVTQMQILY